MDSKERVMTALRHEEPDRIPINFRATDKVISALSHHINMDYEGILEYFQVDFREVIPPYTGPEPRSLPDGSISDVWGVGRKEVITERSRDVMVTFNPLQDVKDPEVLDEYSWPSTDYFDFSAVPKLCNSHNGFAVSTEGIHAEGYHGVFHLLTYLYGMEKVMMDLVLNEELVQKTIEKIMAFFLEYYARLFEAGKGNIDFLFYKDDFGTQSSLLLSKDMFNQYFKSTLVRLVELSESYGATLILHSCGNIFKLIPDFIDAGVKVLDPIQVTANDMDITVLKKQFGNVLTFHGAIDTQGLLPRGKPAEVKKTVEDTITILGKGGGYFFSPSHRLQQDTPVENVIAMYDAAINY